jgi:dipeptidyl aminopeptidase/acylaminoacyl peptidase
MLVARELPYVDVSRAVMYGASRGGLMTYLALRNKIEVKAAAVLCGVSDLLHMYNNRADTMKGILHRLVGNPSCDPNEYIRRSPIHWADEIHVPLLIVHGANDVHVPIEQTRNFVNRLSELHKDYRYIEYPDADHHLLNPDRASEILGELGTFFAGKLGLKYTLS